MEMEGLLGVAWAWPLCRLLPCFPGCSQGLRLLCLQHLWVGEFSQAGVGPLSALRTALPSPHTMGGGAAPITTQV